MEGKPLRIRISPNISFTCPFILFDYSTISISRDFFSVLYTEFLKQCLAYSRYLINLDCLETIQERLVYHSNPPGFLVEPVNKLELRAGGRIMIIRKPEACVYSQLSFNSIVVELLRSKTFTSVGWLEQSSSMYACLFKAFNNMLLSLF